MEREKYEPFVVPPLAEIDPEMLLTLDEAAELVGRTKGAIRVWASRGKITPLNFGDGGPSVYHHLDIAYAERWIRTHGGKRRPPDVPGQRAA